MTEQQNNVELREDEQFDATDIADLKSIVKALPQNPYFEEMSAAIDKQVKADVQDILAIFANLSDDATEEQERKAEADLDKVIAKYEKTDVVGEDRRAALMKQLAVLLELLNNVDFDCGHQKTIGLGALAASAIMSGLAMLSVQDLRESLQDSSDDDSAEEEVVGDSDDGKGPASPSAAEETAVEEAGDSSAEEEKAGE